MVIGGLTQLKSPQTCFWEETEPRVISRLLYVSHSFLLVNTTWRCHCFARAYGTLKLAIASVCALLLLQMKQ